VGHPILILPAFAQKWSLQIVSASYCSPISTDIQGISDCFAQASFFAEQKTCIYIPVFLVITLCGGPVDGYQYHRNMMSPALALLKMETAGFSKTLVSVYQTAQHHTPEDHDVDVHCPEFFFFLLPSPHLGPVFCIILQYKSYHKCACNCIF